MVKDNAITNERDISMKY